MNLDVVKVDRWQCPDGTGVPLITMPNIPRAIQGKGMQPRTIYGKSAWDYMRKKAYYDAGYKCEICGCEPERGRLHGHELFSYDYIAQTGTFERVVAICSRCHDAIHSGRLITMFKHHNPVYSKHYVLEIAERAFKLVSEYNESHPEQEPLRLFGTFAEYLKVPELCNEMAELIDKYGVKFYQDNTLPGKKWNGWKVVIGEREFLSPYKNQADWEKAMAEASRSDNNRGLADPFAEVTKILEDSLDNKTKAE